MTAPGQNGRGLLRAKAVRRPTPEQDDKIVGFDIYDGLLLVDRGPYLIPLVEKHGGRGNFEVDGLGMLVYD